MEKYYFLEDSFRNRMIVSILAIAIFSVFNVFIFFDKNNPQATHKSLADEYQWQRDYPVCTLYSVIPCSNYQHIKVFGLLYGGYFTHGTYDDYRDTVWRTLDPEQRYANLYEWFARHYDLTSSDQGWAGVNKNEISIYNPNISSWQYMTLGGLGYMLDQAAGGINIISRKYLAAENYAQTNGYNFEDYFVHHAQNKTVTNCTFDSGCGASYDGLAESVSYYNGSTYTDWTNKAFGYFWGSDQIRKTYDLPFGQTNSILYFGNLEKFDSLYINLSQNASADWRGVWEYWNGTTWVTLNLLQDTSNELTRSGLIKFLPPSNWAETLLADGNPYTFNSLAYIRLRTLSQGTAQPIARTYQLASGGALQNVPDIGNEAPGISAFHIELYLPRSYTSWFFNENNAAWDRGVAINMDVTFPGWDDKNDVNEDGYVDDSEYANLFNPQATARFKHQSRTSSFFYQYMGHGGNFGNIGYRNFLLNNIANSLYDANNHSGIMFDSLSSRISTRYWGSNISFLEYDSATSTQFFNDVRQTVIGVQNSLPGAIIASNDNLNLTLADIIDGSEGEILFHINETNTNTSVAHPTPTTFLDKFNRIVSNAKQNKLLTLMNVVTNDPTIDVNRERMFGLAAYYLFDYNSTYFWPQSPLGYAKPWDYWFDAIEYDISRADGDWYQWATGVDPSSGGLNQYYIYTRNRENGNKVLVKFKPKYTSSISGNSITTHQLDKAYYILQADGILSDNTVTSVSLRNNEGAILIDPATLVVDPPPPVNPTCSDNIQNGNETGIDCGGNSCPACPNNEGGNNGGGGTPPPPPPPEEPPIVCGNNIEELGEQCDDGNLTNNDGCSYLCQIEIEVTPTSTPTTILEIDKLQGSLVKTLLDPKVYYINTNNQRYFIPNLNTFKSWFKNFNSLTIITPQTLASYEYKGRLTVKPGKLVQFQNSNKVYVVEPEKTLRWIKSGTIFKDFGYDFKKVISLPEEDLQYYTQGEDLAASTIHPTGQLLKHGNYPPIFYIKDNIEYWIKDETTFLSLGFRWQDVITIPVRYWYTRILDNFSFRLKER